MLVSIKSIDKDISLFRNMGGCCRILSLGGELRGQELVGFNQYMTNLLLLAKSVVSKEEAVITVKPSVQENIKNKICATISEIEVKLDEFVQQTTSNFLRLLMLMHGLLEIS